MEDCIALKKEFPHLIAGKVCLLSLEIITDRSIGFDLVGDENVYKPLIHYAEQLLRFRERVEKEKLDIPFIFHAGETLGDGTEADDNLYDAILLGTKRIGHGLVCTPFIRYFGATNALTQILPNQASQTVRDMQREGHCY